MEGTEKSGSPSQSPSDSEEFSDDDFESPRVPSASSSEAAMDAVDAEPSHCQSIPNSTPRSDSAQEFEADVNEVRCRHSVVSNDPSTSTPQHTCLQTCQCRMRNSAPVTTSTCTALACP